MGTKDKDAAQHTKDETLDEQERRERKALLDMWEAHDAPLLAPERAEGGE